MEINKERGGLAYWKQNYLNVFRLGHYLDLSRCIIASLSANQ